MCFFARVSVELQPEPHAVPSAFMTHATSPS
jgi:hypothetical protein